MKIKTSKIWILIAILVITSLACSIQFTDNATPVTILNTEAPLNTLAPASPTAQPVPTQSITSGLMPAGILVDPMDQYGIKLYNLAGQSITELKAPNAYSFDLGEVHMAGKVSGQITTPLVFITWNNDQRAVLMSVNDSISTIRQSNDLYKLVGAAGSDVIVFTEAAWPTDGSGGITNNVYFGKATDLTPYSAPIFVQKDSEGWAYQPLAVRDDPSGQGFFYTRAAYGIGGDIVFAPLRGLYYYDAVAYAQNQVLMDDRNPVGISPDLVWVASTLESDLTDLKLLNMKTLVSVSLPIEGSSDRGAGDLVFSPDDHFVAWMEGSGYMMSDSPNFVTRVKAATTDGNVVLNIPSANFASIIGTTAAWTQPVGFIDNSNVLIQVRGSEWTDTYIVKIDVTTQAMSLFCKGDFLGFYYP